MCLKLYVEYLSQHILCLLNIQVGCLQPKNLDIHVSRKSVLDSSVVNRVELKGGGRKYMRVHLKGGILRHDLHRNRTILFVAKAGI